MSTEYIVNQAAPTPFYKADEEQLEQLKSHGVEIVEPELAEESPVAEPLTDMEPDTDEPAKLEDVINQRDAVKEEADTQAAKLKLNLMLSSFQQKVVDQDEYNLGFQEFQQKVIRAFQHLGLDTKRFFG